MKKRFLCVALAPALVALGGCSALGINFSDDKVQYNAAQSRTNLEVHQIWHRFLRMIALTFRLAVAL